MAASMITSPIVAPTSLPSLSRRGSSFAVVCSGGKKIKVDKPLGTSVITHIPCMHALVTMRSMDGFSGLIRGNLCYSAGLGGGLTVDIDANGRKVGKKGVYQFVDKYGANVDGYR